MSHLLRLTIVPVALAAIACGDSDVPPSIPAAPARGSLADVPDSLLTRLASRTILFGHQSVGANLLKGITEWSAREPRLGLAIRDFATTGTDTAAGGVLDVRIGANGDPARKNESFLEAARSAAGQRADIVAQKYCYLDFGPGVDPAAVFEGYRRQVETLRQDRPGRTIVHVTTPLTVPETGVKAFAKRLLGRTTRNDLNASRARYNELLRQTYGDRDPIFDLAAYQSFGPGDRWAGSIEGGRPVPALAAEWTNDGGHLNEAGRRMIAEQFLVFLARLD